MLGSLFSRSRLDVEASDCSGLEPDPEWDELIAWAGIGPKAGPGSVSVVDSKRDQRDQEQAVAAEAMPAAEPAPAYEDASAEQAEWAALIAQAKLGEQDEWAEVIARAKTVAVLPVDELSLMRARLEKVAAERLARWEADAAADEWELAIRRAKQM